MKLSVNYPECFKAALETGGYRHRSLHGKYETYLVWVPSAYKLASVWSIKPSGEVGVTCILECVSEEWNQILDTDFINELNCIHRFAKITIEKKLVLFSYDFFLCGDTEIATATAATYLTLIIDTIIPSIQTSVVAKMGTASVSGNFTFNQFQRKIKKTIDSL